MHKPLVIVTGGCGYIGSHTILDLLNNGFDVVSIDNFLRSRNYALDGIEKISGVRVFNHAVDLCDYAMTQQVFDQYSNIVGVIHFAALNSPCTSWLLQIPLPVIAPVAPAKVLLFSIRLFYIRFYSTHLTLHQYYFLK